MFLNDVVDILKAILMSF